MKLFRKIRERLLKENKLTRYLIYGIGEITLVVIGILIAVAINNSNIEKIDELKETKYLNNIKLDLQKDLASLDFNLTLRKERYRGTSKLISQINGQPIENLTELVINVANNGIRLRGCSSTDKKLAVFLIQNHPNFYHRADDFPDEKRPQNSQLRYGSCP